MARFSAIMDVVFKWEGGFVDHPNDPGGATNMGITHKVLADWRGVSAVSKQEVKNLTRDEAEDIFRDRYFKVIRGDDLPEPIDLIMMDGAVNHGPGTMVKMLEAAIDETQNGVLSAQTVAAIKRTYGSKKKLAGLAVELAEARKARYLSRPHAESFMRGWKNRLNDVMSVALASHERAWNFDSGTDETSTCVCADADPVSTLIRPVIEDDDLQRALAAWGDYGDAIDGIFGRNSVAATDQALRRNSSIISGNWPGWSVARKKIALAQLICREQDIPAGRIDGLFGPNTEEALMEFNLRRLNLPKDGWLEELDDAKTPAFKKTEPKGNAWPRQASMVQFYGKPCQHGHHTGACGPGRIKLTRLELPFTMKLAWDINVKLTGFAINHQVRDSAARVFEKVYKEYKDDGVEDLGINLFGGCYNCRPIRGGTRCSTHSWGIAIDFDPARNRLRWDHKRARLAKPDAQKFWEFWEAEGWLSLGRARDFDWMHVQAARL